MLNPSENCLPNSIPLHSILESFVDGILLLTPEGDELYCNDFARKICQKLNHYKPVVSSIPREIWRVCQMVLKSCSLHSGENTITESEVLLDGAALLRIRVQSIPLEATETPCLLVMLEDHEESLRNRAIAEAKQYKLTPRQSEVWLLRRVGCSYKEIATELYISPNTVRKHLKDIYLRQRAY